MLRDALRDTVVYGLSSLLSRGLAIFLLPIYTRVLSPSDFGAYDLLITLCALANLVVALEISQGFARQLVDAPDAGRRTVLASTTLFFTLVMYGLFLGIGLAAAEPFNRWLLGDERHLTAFRVGICFIAISGIQYLLLNQFRWELRSKAFAVASLAYAIATLVFAAVFCVWLQMGLSGVMAAQLVAASSSVAMCLWMLRKSFSLAIDFGALREMLCFSTPLVPAGLAVFVSLYINRLALSHFATLADVGFYGIANRIASMSMLLILGVQAALTPLVYKHHRSPETPAQIAQLFSWFAAAALAGCLFLAIYASELLSVLATGSYSAAASLVALLAPALLISQMYVFAPGMAIQKKTDWQLWVTMLSAAVSGIGNWILVPQWGATGAAVAMLVSALVFFGAWVVASQRLYPIPYRWQPIWVSTTAFALLAAGGGALEQFELSDMAEVGAKAVLMGVMVLVIVASRLLSVRDLSALGGLIRQRIGDGVAR